MKIFFDVSTTNYEENKELFIFSHNSLIKNSPAQLFHKVIDELGTSLVKNGFKEIHVWDDMFATDLKRAKEVCDEIMRRKLKFTWQLECGVRVNSVDKEFFEKCVQAGCYKVAFGFESGSDYILKSINKSNYHLFLLFCETLQIFIHNVVPI